MATPHVAVVVLNYHRLADARECLASVFAGSYPSMSVILLDLGSTRDQQVMLQRAHPHLQIVPLAENRGYAGNNNRGIRLALEQGADWVLLLNEDTRADPECVAELTAAAAGDSRVGVVGPLVYHYGAPSVIQSAGGRLDARWWPTHLGAGEPDRGQLSEPRRVDWVTGCAIQIRRPVLEQVGLLDERFFAYWEETEFCVRARQDGWGILNAPRAKVWHKGGQPDRSIGPEITYYMVRNRFFLLARHRAPWSAWLAAWSGTLRALAAMTFRPTPSGTPAHRAALVQGIRDFLRHRGGPMPPTRR
jgi:GT2 family glycosyltransferase